MSSVDCANLGTLESLEAPLVWMWLQTWFENPSRHVGNLWGWCRLLQIPRPHNMGADSGQMLLLHSWNRATSPQRSTVDHGSFSSLGVSCSFNLWGLRRRRGAAIWRDHHGTSDHQMEHYKYMTKKPSKTKTIKNHEVCMWVSTFFQPVFLQDLEDSENMSEDSEEMEHVLWPDAQISFLDRNRHQPCATLCLQKDVTKIVASLQAWR